MSEESFFHVILNDAEKMWLSIHKIYKTFTIKFAELNHRGHTTYFNFKFWGSHESREDFKPRDVYFLS
jgi:hypothetical protein